MCLCGWVGGGWPHGCVNARHGRRRSTSSYFLSISPPTHTHANNKTNKKTGIALDMTADGARLAAANYGSSAAYNGLYTFTYGLPAASVWQQTTKVAGAPGQNWNGIAIADDAARVYAAGVVFIDGIMQVGSGQV